MAAAKLLRVRAPHNGAHLGASLRPRIVEITHRGNLSGNFEERMKGTLYGIPVSRYLPSSGTTRWWHSRS
eukprot:scaffold3351_cov242-Pinguiococcus_pyrenoidosus.AAC.3